MRIGSGSWLITLDAEKRGGGGSILITFAAHGSHGTHGLHGLQGLQGLQEPHGLQGLHEPHGLHGLHGLHGKQKDVSWKLLVALSMFL